MELENYRDLSANDSGGASGFQFEFYCTQCSRKWKSPFKPYRIGQFTSLVSRLSFLFGVGHKAGAAAQGFADHGSRKARDEAFAEATRHAATLYTVCKSCKKEFCADCLDPNGTTCVACLQIAARERTAAVEQQSVQARERAMNACPNCGTGNPGGRFCSECGFDMASTHKSCPTCGTLLLRQARFCTDCGHGF